MSEWQDISTAPKGGAAIRARFYDAVGSYEGPPIKWIDGQWVNAQNSNIHIKATPIQWMPESPQE
ncbi:hypothetical protein LCGC14_2240980 [marine sediment metagenome]|uniref:Uncharacterized protein n=1 Tax=marine sediment metagenome TaxID=412755 RepID=A0A0F9DT12_9ZZZZ